MFTCVCSQSMDGYYDYDEFLAKATSYEHDFLEEQTFEGRDIPYIKLGDSNGLENRKSILLVGGLNASPIALSQLFWNIDRLMAKAATGFSQISALLKTNYIYIVPMLNVDGYKYISDNWESINHTQSADATRRKNSNNLNHLNCTDAEAGVDLSRNFGYQWGYDEAGSSDDPCSPNYRGSEAFSEPETRGLRDLATSLDVSLYMSYGTGKSFYVKPYSYTYNLESYNGPFEWFYEDIEGALHWEYNYGTMFELIGVEQNGVDIDYFEHIIGSAALQVLIPEVDLDDNYESGSPATLVENYEMFEEIVLRTSNTFEAYGTLNSVAECVNDCATNSVAIMSFWVSLFYKDLADSAPVYLKFQIENPRIDYKLYFRNLISTVLYHRTDEDDIQPMFHEIEVDDENIEFELDLGSIPKETTLDIEIQIEYSKVQNSTEPEPRFIEYKYYVGFFEDKTNSELEDLIYNKYDIVALKHSIHEEETLVTEIRRKDDDDNDGGSSGLNKDEKIAVGVTVTMVVLIIIVVVVLLLVGKKKRGHSRQGTAAEGKFRESPKNPQLYIPDIPQLTDRTGNAGATTDHAGIQLEEKTAS